MVAFKVIKKGQAKIRVIKKAGESRTKRVVNKVLRYKGIIPEVKFIYTIVSGTALTTAGVMDSLVLIAQGNDENNRQGDRISVRSIEIRGYIANTGAANYEQATVALLNDRQPNGAIPAFSVATTATTASPFSQYTGGSPSGGAMMKNLNWARRFSIYRQGQYARSQSFLNGGYIVKNFTIRKNFKQPLTVEYSNTTGAIGSVGTNNICFGYSNINGSSGVIYYVARVSYTDV